MEIKEEEWAEWRQHPVTLALNKYLREVRVGLMEQWASKAFQGETRDEILTLNAAALGQIEHLDRLIELELKDFNEVLEDVRD